MLEISTSHLTNTDCREKALGRLTKEIQMNKTVFAAYLIPIAIALAWGVGWVMNIITLIGADFSNITGLLVLRVVGIFIVPLGGVLGYF
jgi:hypothetical protein